MGNQEEEVTQNNMEGIGGSQNVTINNDIFPQMVAVVTQLIQNSQSQASGNGGLLWTNI